MMIVLLPKIQSGLNSLFCRKVHHSLALPTARQISCYLNFKYLPFQRSTTKFVYYLAESEVISFQWSPTVFKLKFSMECHLTSSLTKGQPVLENKTTCCNQLLIQHLLHREDAVIVKLTKLITLPDGEILTKGIRRSLPIFRRFDNLNGPVRHSTLSRLRLFTVPYFFVRSFRYAASYRHGYLNFQMYRGGGRRGL